MEEGDDDEVEEAGLGFGDVCGRSVTEERYRKVFTLLKITLIEEFLEEEPGPLDCDIELASLCGDIGSVHEEF